LNPNYLSLRKPQGKCFSTRQLRALRFDGHECSRASPGQRDRWKRAVANTNAALGDAVGKLYARRYFPSSEKARAQEMVCNLLEAFDRPINRLDWMAAKTKARTKAKRALLKVGVGYPERRPAAGTRSSA
jgi:putative endopeptidase